MFTDLKFSDLLSLEIQPGKIDIHHLPEITISEELQTELKELLEKEESNYAQVFSTSAYVQTDKNYVFFSTHWLYAAILCRKYAEALRPYGDFFDKEIRKNNNLMEMLLSGNKEPEIFKEILPDETDRIRMMGYITGKINEQEFRPGKALLNGKGARSTKDIFGSCVLKKIAIPDSSANYLGVLVYYLAKRPELYAKLEKEIMEQLDVPNNEETLPSVVKECAKAIVDAIYKADRFARMEDLFVVMDHNIKVDTSAVPELLPTGNSLRYMFARPSSELYDSKIDEGKTRVFEEEYKIPVAGEKLTCRLTTEWKGKDIPEDASGNYLKALIILANNYYSDIFEIKEESDKYLLKYKQTEFNYGMLPSLLQGDFQKRYITSLLAKPFVILTGNSGTGKTRISKQFAEYLEFTDLNGEKNWLLVPVGADWTDNTRILGFYNPLGDNGKGRYEKTGIVKLIERANENPEVPYFLILDEMNLSHVERYFSDFLSHMETPDTPFELDGYKNIAGDGEKTEVLEKLPYPDNLFVIGTVNIDETTYMFSPKVLDRANVIEYKPEKQDVLDLLDGAGTDEKIVPAVSGVAEAFLRLAKDIRAGKTSIATEDIGTIQTMFEVVYDYLEPKGFEFAFRTVREIRQYICAANAISDTWDSNALNDAADEQILQKILPKIHGNKKEIGSLLEELEKFCNGTNMLPQSAKKIEQMKGKLDSVQYASFI